MLVTDFLNQHFPQIMDYQFTAHVEDELDEIALGKNELLKNARRILLSFSRKS